MRSELTNMVFSDFEKMSRGRRMRRPVLDAQLGIFTVNSACSGISALFHSGSFVTSTSEAIGICAFSRSSRYCLRATLSSLCSCILWYIASSPVKLMVTFPSKLPDSSSLKRADRRLWETSLFGSGSRKSDPAEVREWRSHTMAATQKARMAYQDRDKNLCLSFSPTQCLRSAPQLASSL